MNYRKLDRLSVGDVELATIDWGGNEDGDLLLLLHGIGNTGWHWNSIAPLLVDALGSTYQVVSFDQRGHGDSSMPKTGYHVDLFALDVLTVTEHFGRDRADLVGHSRGGWTAAYVASHWPERVERLVLLDPARLGYADLAEQETVYGPQRKKLGPFDSMDEAVEFVHQRELERFPGETVVWSPERQESEKVAYRAVGGQIVAKMEPHVLEELAAARLGLDPVVPWLHRLTSPTMLIVADKSKPGRIDEKLAYRKHIPECDMRFLHGTHFLQYDCTDELLELLREFLSRG